MAVGYQIGTWRVEPRLLEVSSADEVRRVGPKVMALLECLARQPGAVVTKEELVAAVWNGDFTTDEALAAVIYELRKALDDDARRPRYVETIRGSGYRLVAPISHQETETAHEPVEPAAEGSTLAHTEAEAAPVAESTEAPDSTTSMASTAATQPAAATPSAAPPTATPPDAESEDRRPRWWLLVLGAAAAALLLATWLLNRTPAPPAEPPMPEIRSLAVLPLNTFTDGFQQSELASALTAMLTADLAQSCPVEITPGISVREHPEAWSLQRAATVLGVDAVVEGSVLRSGDRLWISVELVETQTGRMLWHHSYDRQLGDELLVLREVALDVAERLQVITGASAPS